MSYLATPSSSCSCSLHTVCHPAAPCAHVTAKQILMLMAWIDMMACKDLQDPYGYWPLAGVHGLNWPYQGHKPGKQ